MTIGLFIAHDPGGRTAISFGKVICNAEQR